MNCADWVPKAEGRLVPKKTFGSVYPLPENSTPWPCFPVISPMAGHFLKKRGGLGHPLHYKEDLPENRFAQRSCGPLLCPRGPSGRGNNRPVVCLLWHGPPARHTCGGAVGSEARRQNITPTPTPAGTMNGPNPGPASFKLHSNKALIDRDTSFSESVGERRFPNAKRVQKKMAWNLASAPKDWERAPRVRWRKRNRRREGRTTWLDRSQRGIT